MYQFCARPFEEEEEDGEIGCLQFHVRHCSSVFYENLRVLLRIETLVGHVMCLTGLIHVAAAVESSEPLHLLGLNRRVSAIPT